MARIVLTDRFIKSRRPAPAGERHDHWDALVPGLALRVSDKGAKSFVLIARFPANPKNPTRRSLGTYGAITLEGARDRARKWLGLIATGIDPKIEEARKRATALRNQANSFAHVAEEFKTRHVSTFARAQEANRIIDAEFVKRWGSRPAADILPEEVAAAIRAIVKRGSPYTAHNALGHLKRLYSWAIGTHEFGLTASPGASLKPTDLIGEREARNRILTDEELRAVWKAAAAMGEPYGMIVQLLILTGQRLSEIAELQWSEVDLEDKRALTIGAQRTKNGASHLVPLSDDAVAILDHAPRWPAGSFLFSTTLGEKPVNGFSKAKARLDKLCGVEGWRLHDLRRSARTHFSALPVQDIVRELVIGHARPGLHKIYDLHAYETEKRECLDLWARRLRSIVEPSPAGVTNLTAERARRAGV
jgi:integrase